MIKLAQDTINREDINALVEWLNKDPIPRLTKGELSSRFERKWAGMLGTKYSIFVNSGSSAILLSLYSLLLSGRLKNKKIVVPGLSWITDISSLLQLGFKPILCDCNMRDLSLDLNHLRNLFEKEKPSAVILVSVLGIIPYMYKIMEICQEYDVILIEDVCESMGSSYRGKNLGTFGMVSTFSTYFGHTISTIEGGLVNTNDDDLYKIMLCCRNHGWDRDLGEDDRNRLKVANKINDFNQMYTFYYPGFNLRSTDLQAFLGLRQLDKLNDVIAVRFRNFKRYKERLNSISEIDIRLGEQDVVSNLGFPFVSFRRKEIIGRLKENDIEIRPLIAGNIVRQPFWTDKSCVLPNCDIVHDYGFYLPNHQSLSLEEVDFICDIIINTINNGLDTGE